MYRQAFIAGLLHLKSSLVLITKAETIQPTLTFHIYDTNAHTFKYTFYAAIFINIF